MQPETQSIIGISVGIIGLIVAVVGTWHGYRARQVKLLRCQMEGYTYHDQADPIHKDLKLHWKGREISRLARTACTITNIGTVTIRQSDLASTQKITFTVPTKEEILSTTVGFGRTDNTVFIIPTEPWQTNLTFEFLEPGEALEIEFLHTCASSEELKVHAYVIGGRFWYSWRSPRTEPVWVPFKKSWSRIECNDVRICYECETRWTPDGKTNPRDVIVSAPFPVKADASQTPPRQPKQRKK